MFFQDLVLKSDELFFVGAGRANRGGQQAAGLFLRDTRHLAQLQVTLSNTTAEVLSVRIHNAATATLVTANELLMMADGTQLPRHSLVVEHHISLDTAMNMVSMLQNFSGRAVTLKFGIELAADFADLFDVRGFVRSNKGTLMPPAHAGTEVRFGYREVSGLESTTGITFSREPTYAVTHNVLPATSLTESAEFIGATAEFAVEIAAGERWELRTTVTPSSAAGGPVSATPSFSGQVAANDAMVSTSDPTFNILLERSSEDLKALQTTFGDGPLPAAGIPWFVAPFGRDCLITGLQTFHLAPVKAGGILRALAALQGTEDDAWREEEPGKILHEMRYGEMARTGQIPHSPYFGAVDSTPLFVWLFAETINWSGDEALYADLLPSVMRAIEWIETRGDLDGDGLVEYRSDRAEGGRIRHQTWKDSHDSVNHLNGEPANGQIAAIEVQGYVYAAYNRLAMVVDSYGDLELAASLRQRADTLQARVEQAFWMEEAGFYAQALDGDKLQVATISSNPGHLLLTGLPSDERAGKMIDRLRRSDMDSGWGVRTLSSASRTYNPMSYHNGSVWPHDNSLIAAGCYKCGRHEDGDAIFRSLRDAGNATLLGRLPELYCGFGRTGSAAERPVEYPVSCSPQAWASGAFPLLSRAMVGLRSDLTRRGVQVTPHLPSWLQEITFQHLNVLGVTGNLTVRREGDGYLVESDNLTVASVDQLP